MLLVKQRPAPCRAVLVVLISVLLVLGGFSEPARAAARARVLRGLEVRDAGDEWRIRVLLDLPVRYLRHSPEAKSDSVVIELVPLALGAGTPPELVPHQALRPAPGESSSPLVEVLYERNGSDSLKLEVRFARAVEHVVTLGADSRSLEIRLPMPGTLPRSDAPRRTPAPAPASSRAEKLLIEARRAITANELNRATTLLRKAVDVGEDDVRVAQDAKELLGVTLERRGQQAHARAEYEQYLERWPDADGALRVQQRLDALLTARAPGRDTLRETRRRREARPTEYDLYGSLSASFTRAESISGVTEDELYDSSAYTDVALTGRVRDPRFELRSELIGSYRFDFIESGSGDDTRISRLFVDFETPDRRFAATLGRQSRSNGGVLGRFDGLRLEKALGNPEFARRIVVSALGGLLVDGPSQVSVSTDRAVYSAAVDFERLLGNLDAQLFFTGQQNEGFVDRMAVGGELRWIERGRFGLAFVDYDVHFQMLNTALLTGHLELFERWTLHALAETRMSPILTLENALSGQVGVDDLDGLSDLFGRSDLESLAEDRSARSWTGSFGLTHRTSERLQLAGDLTLTGTDNTPASGGVAATSSFGPEVRIGTQASINDLLMDGDYTNLGLSHRFGEFSDTTSLSASLRLPVARELRTTLRFRGDYSDGSGGNVSIERVSLRPSLRLDWRTRALGERFDLVLDGEVGLDWSDDLAAELASDSLGYFGEFVVRLDF